MASGYAPSIPHRRSIRLKDYDYRENGAYFVTICTADRIRLFGDAKSDGVALNLAGQVVSAFWLGIPKHCSRALLDEYVVIPNHLHGIIVLNHIQRTQADVGTNNSP